MIGKSGSGEREGRGWWKK